MQRGSSKKSKGSRKSRGRADIGSFVITSLNNRASNQEKANMRDTLRSKSKDIDAADL